MKKLIILAVALVLFLGVIGAQCGEQSGTTKDGAKITLDQMAEIQPGLGVLMMEIGERYWVLFYAGNDGNWDLASYEVKEIGEAMEVANVTRPKRKEALESFKDTALDPIDKAIKAKNVADFKAKFDAGTKACNGCHDATGHAFINWKLPAERPPTLETKP